MLLRGMDAAVIGEYKAINFQIYNFARAKISIRENSILWTCRYMIL